MAYGVGGDALEPVIVEVEEHHLRLCGLQDQVSQLLHLGGERGGGEVSPRPGGWGEERAGTAHLEAGLERQLQLTALDDDVREVQQMHLWLDEG